MKAIVQHRYGTPDVLELAEVERPDPGDGEVLVRVRAAAVNPYDWHLLTGTPYVVRTQAGLRRPSQATPGVDFAGTVEAVGSAVTSAQPGDDVFGMRAGAFAEYVCVGADRMIAPMPKVLSFEQAAALPMAAMTALQGLRDKGQLRSGHAVLVNGASGGVGTFAVQIAKSYGAEVTGVCSTRNLELVRSLGADHVLDYTSEDFTAHHDRYDVVLDTAGVRSLMACRRALRPNGTYVAVGGQGDGKWMGPLIFLAKVVAAGKLGNRSMRPMLTKSDPADLAAVHDLVEAGAVRPVIDRHYPLDEVPAALAYVGEGHARGKVVITT